MKQSEKKDKNFQDISNEYQKFLESIDEKNSEYRKKLADEKCEKIYDALFLEVKENNKIILKFKEICKLTGMNHTTLSRHLKHLEEKGFIIKNVETRYKKSYQINLVRVGKVCRIKKTITGKEKLELIDITKLRTGDTFIPMEPVTQIPRSETNPKSALSNKKSKRHFKAHKNIQ